MNQVSHPCFQNPTHWTGLGFNFLASCFSSIDPNFRKRIASVAFNFPTHLCTSSETSGPVIFLVGLAQIFSFLITNYSCNRGKKYQLALEINTLQLTTYLSCALQCSHSIGLSMQLSPPCFARNSFWFRVECSFVSLPRCEIQPSFPICS